MEKHVIEWLLSGDAGIRWQTMHDLTGALETEFYSERTRVAEQGWGKQLLDLQDSSGMWGGGLYSPKWISTTYTMLLLRHLGLHPRHPAAWCACELLLERGLYTDGGINFSRSKSHKYSETCVTGLILALLAYFQYGDERIQCLVNFVLEQQMPDGGLNCQSFNGAVHSSFHTTIMVLEGLLEFTRFSDYNYNEIQTAIARAIEFLLEHKLYKSHRTGAIVHKNLTLFSFPPHWHYDVLRALDFCRDLNCALDPRMQDALNLVREKRGADGCWKLQNQHPGRTFFTMEQPGKPSRWNTLRALRVLKWVEDLR